MSEPEQDPGQEREPADGTGGRRTVLITVGSIVVLAVVGLVVYLLVRPDGEDEAAPDVPTVSGEAPPETTSAQAPPSAPVSSGGGEVTAPPPPPADEQVAAARTVVDDAISAINSQDVAAMALLACDPAAVGQPEDLQAGITAVLAENPEITGDKATAQVQLSIEGGGAPTVVPLPLEKRADGTWCVP